MDTSITLPRKIRNEDEIIASWKGDISKPLVSIRCTAFNHVQYIEDAIKGFLIQETNFPFEIWIHDDASTDGTREIIQHYQSKYPRIIKSILQSENQYSKGNRPGAILMSKCIGEYCAVCEGDDYWIDPLKLQNQITVLEQKPMIDMVMHPAIKIDEMTGGRQVIGQYASESGLVSLQNIITKKYGQIPTASIVVRKSVHAKVISFRERNPYLTVGDIYLQIFGAENGAAFYINKISSVYRWRTLGSWTSAQMTSPAKRAIHAIARIESFNALMRELPKHSQEALVAANSQWLMKLIKSQHYTSAEKLSYFFNYNSCLSFRYKFLALLFCLMPKCVVKLLSSMKHRFVAN